MDDDNQELEAELKRMAPSPPSSVVVARIERALGGETAHGARRARGTHWSWAALPAAAVLAIVAIQLVRRGIPPPENAAPSIASAKRPGTLKPVSAENVLYAVYDLGLVTLEDGTPARRSRLNYVDTIVWKNPDSHASLTWSVPREEIQVVPVIFQ